LIIASQKIFRLTVAQVFENSLTRRMFLSIIMLIFIDLLFFSRCRKCTCKKSEKTSC